MLLYWDQETLKWFFEPLYMSGCVVEVYTVVLWCVLLWLCGSVYVSGISSVFQLLLMYRWRVTLPIYTTIQSKLQWHLHPFLSSLPHHSQTANISSQSVLPSLSSICRQTLSLFSQCQDGHWIQTIMMHMSIFETNYILSTPSFRHSLDFIPCSPNQLSINHMPLETKYLWRFSWTVHIFRRKADPSTW